MEFRHWLRLQEKTLYHGTIRDHEQSIRQIGLFGQVGDFQQDAGYSDDEYGEPPNEDDEVVYMTDKKRFDKAVTAMYHHIARKLGKHFHDVTENDIRNHGLLCIMRDRDDVDQRPEEDDYRSYRTYPRGAEPGDYYAPSERPDAMVKGATLIRLLKRGGYLYSSQDVTKRNRERLIAAALKHHPQIPKPQVLQKVLGLSDAEVKDYLRYYTEQ